jgi:hypothetical protein
MGYPRPHLGYPEAKGKPAVIIGSHPDYHILTVRLSCDTFSGKMSDIRFVERL